MRIETDGAGTETETILIGSDTPVGGGCYVSVSGSVYIVEPRYVKYYLTAADDYRDKTIAQTDMTSFEQLEIYKNGEKTAVIKRSEAASSSDIIDTSLMSEYPYSEFVSENRLLDTFGTRISITAESFEMFDYIYKFAHIFSIGDVSEVSFEANGEKYVLSQKDGEYFINSKKISYEEYKNAYGAVIGVMITSEGDESKCGGKIGGAAFKLKDGASEATGYFEYDERNYAVKRNGSVFCVLKKNIEAAASALKICAAGG